MGSLGLLAIARFGAVVSFRLLLFTRTYVLKRRSLQEKHSLCHKYLAL